MARLVRLACFSSIAAVLGCSALVDTDPGRLGGEVPGADAGPEVDADGVDGGPGLDGGDGGPVLDGGSADTGPRPDASTPDCPAPPTCDGDVRIFCDRSGTLQREACEGGCAGGACVAPRPWRPSNVDASHWAADAGDLDLREGGIFDTTTCRATSARTAIVESGGQSLCVVSFGSLRVREGVRLRVVGTRAAVFMVDGEARIEGTLDASAEGIRPGPGGFRGGVQNQVDGGGPGAGEAGANSSFDDGGGGGGGACGEGGDGGDGGAASGGAGGAAVLAGRTLEPLIGGSGGGRGRGAFYTGGTNAGLGGAGGGAIQISARGRLVVTGQILAGGGGGLPGSRGGTGSTNGGSGGGGGAALISGVPSFAWALHPLANAASKPTQTTATMCFFDMTGCLLRSRSTAQAAREGAILSPAGPHAEVRSEFAFAPARYGKCARMGRPSGRVCRECRRTRPADPTWATSGGILPRPPGFRPSSRSIGKT
ncbi:MAG: hypothetical protein KF901_27865 [Myxococcales bacterium]|nr:hypothetical protein [Myxococcales bacterium]